MVEDVSKLIIIIILSRKLTKKPTYDGLILSIIKVGPLQKINEKKIVRDKFSYIS